MRIITPEGANKRIEDRNTASDDLNSKTVFRNTRLAAELFGYLTEEFKGMDPAEIENYIIKDTDNFPMEFRDELYDPNTGYITLDTILEAIVPGKTDHVRIRFNLEMQQNLSTQYHLSDRAQMYAGMLLATQNKDNRGDRKYRNLKRCYTVWICPNAPKELEGKIASYNMRLNGRPIPGLFFRSLMDIIIIFPEKAAEGRRKSVTDMLSLVFSDGLKIDKCQQLLREKYKITLDLYSLKKVRIVTDWYGEGVINGETRAKAETIIGMMEEFGCSLEKALEVAKVSDEDRPWVLEEIEEIRNSS